MAAGKCGARLVPVPGIEPVLAAAARLRPNQVSGFIEAILMDWTRVYDDFEFGIQMHLPADKAFGFGFIDADQRRRSMAEARQATLQEMAAIISDLGEDEGHHREALEQSMGDDRLFADYAGRIGIEFSITRATWTWPGQSVIDEFLAGTRADAVQWLASWAHRTCSRMLRLSMEQAWSDGFHRPAGYWLPTPM